MIYLGLGAYLLVCLMTAFLVFVLDPVDIKGVLTVTALAGLSFSMLCFSIASKLVFR